MYKLLYKEVLILVAKKELVILSALRENARYSLTEMSRKTRIPVSTLYDRLKSYKGGLIKKYTSVVDFSRLGYGARANLLIKVPRNKIEEIKVFLLNHRSVNNLVKTNNGFNFFLEVIFRNVIELEIFIEKMENIFELIDKKVFYVIEELRREAFLSDPSYLNIINFS